MKFSEIPYFSGNVKLTQKLVIIGIGGRRKKQSMLLSCSFADLWSELTYFQRARLERSSKVEADVFDKKVFHK